MGREENKKLKEHNEKNQMSPLYLIVPSMLFSLARRRDLMLVTSLGFKLHLFSLSVLTTSFPLRLISNWIFMQSSPPWNGLYRREAGRQLDPGWFLSCYLQKSAYSCPALGTERLCIVWYHTNVAVVLLDLIWYLHTALSGLPVQIPTNSCPSLLSSYVTGQTCS